MLAKERNRAVLTGHTTRASGKFTNDRDVTGPTVSDRQQRVIDELDKMQTDDFWLTAAHRNEVYDRDRDIRYMAQQNRETLAQQLSPNPS